MTWIRSAWKRSMGLAHRYALWGDRHLPWGVRAGLGVLAMVFGVFGFLPVIGFWMIPLGAALIALDVPPWRRGMLRWLERQGS